MNERGNYGPNGHYAHVGADQPTTATPWWKIAIGAAVIGGAAYLLTRPIVKEMQDLEREGRARAREVGITPGMSQAEQNRAWDAYYTKKGLKLEEGDLMRVRAAARY
jgi:hypothetical protein